MPRAQGCGEAAYNPFACPPLHLRPTGQGLFLQSLCISTIPGGQMSEVRATHGAIAGAVAEVELSQEKWALPRAKKPATSSKVGKRPSHRKIERN